LHVGEFDEDGAGEMAEIIVVDGEIAAYQMSRGGKNLERRMEFMNPKSMNFSRPRIDGSWPRMYARNRRDATKRSSSNTMTANVRLGVTGGKTGCLCFFRIRTYATRKTAMTATSPAFVNGTM
jgi:hypothetical protein